MGADYIGGGMTIEKTKTIEDVRALVESFRDKLVAKLDDIDPAGFFDDEETARDELINYIVDGVLFLNHERQSSRYAAVWDIPEHEDIVFITFGGMSWGDSPFEGYDGLVMAGDAAHFVPEFGRAIGVLGGGICLAYGD